MRGRSRLINCRVNGPGLLGRRGHNPALPRSSPVYTDDTCELQIPRAYNNYTPLLHTHNYNPTYVAINYVLDHNRQQHRQCRPAEIFWVLAQKNKYRLM